MQDTSSNSAVDPYRPPEATDAPAPELPVGATHSNQAPTDIRNQEQVVLTLPGHTPEQAAERVFQFFSTQQYKLEEGTPTQATYGIGSPVLRVLFGAFVKRHKFSVVVTAGDQANNHGAQIQVGKAMSGAMGGVIGYQNYKKEFERICLGLSSQLTA